MDDAQRQTYETDLRAMHRAGFLNGVAFCVALAVLAVLIWLAA